MAFANKPIRNLEKEDIEDLFASKEPEGKNIEYKSSIAYITDDKREFLADVSSFANTAGGHIVFGIKEEKGVPVELSGVEIANADVEKIRIADIVREGITPRVQGLSVEPVDLKNGKSALVIYIPKSYSAPHMVSYQGGSRFYARHSVGKKYQLDVHELRQAFLLSETVSEKIRDFRLSRVAQITADETPIALYGKQRIIAHIIPLASFATYQSIDIRNIGEDAQKKFNPSYYHHRHNIDGHVSCNSSTHGNAGSYYQIFRAGQIEHVESDLTREDKHKGVLYFPSLVLKQHLITACDEALRLQKHYGIEQPIFVFFSLTNVKSIRLAVHDRLDEDTPAFDRDIILTREVMLENYPADEKQLRLLIKPALDEIWNAAGYAECPYSREDLQ